MTHITQNNATVRSVYRNRTQNYSYNKLYHHTLHRHLLADCLQHVGALTSYSCMGFHRLLRGHSYVSACSYVVSRSHWFEAELIVARLGRDLRVLPSHQFQSRTNG
jgi:hypothetical protein